MFFYLTLAVSVSALESNEISDHTDTIECICDLTQYSCDNYCCCDSDCKSALISVWTDLGQCNSPKFTSYGFVYCSKSGHFFVESKETDTIDPLYKLLCVQYNNAPEWGKYNVLILDNFSVDTISNLIEDYPQYPATIVPSQYNPGHSALLPEDKMRAIYNDWEAYDSIWTLPGPDSSGKCLYTSPIRWLIPNSPQTCNVYLDSTQPLSSQITVDHFLSNLVISNTAYAATTGISVQSGIFTLRSSTGDSILKFTPKTACAGDPCHCSYVVVQADYLIYTNEDQQTISKIVVNLFVESITSCTVTQTFSAKFYTSETAADTSGNPGYIKGKKLITAVNGSNFVINSEMKMFGAGASGNCVTVPYSYSPIVEYGQDSIYSCTIGKTLSTLQSFCEADITSQYIFSSNTVTHIAKFGNIQTDEIDDWVEISYTAPTAGVWDSTNKSCKIPGILVYDIFYTSVGPYQNPQDKIIHVEKYYQYTDWVYQFSDSTTSQTFFMSVVINYIPYQQRDDPYFYDINTDVLVSSNVAYAVQTSASLLLQVLILIIII